MTEAEAGSDVQGIRTTAVRDGEEYVINGRKMFITNAEHGNAYAVLTKTDVDADPPYRGMSCFIVLVGKIVSSFDFVTNFGLTKNCINLLLQLSLSWKLEPFSFCCSEAIPGVADIVGTLRRGDGSQGWPHRRPQARHRTRGDRAQAGFEFGKDLLNGIEVRAVRGQIEQLCADGFNRLADPGHFMAGQIV